MKGNEEYVKNLVEVVKSLSKSLYAYNGFYLELFSYAQGDMGLKIAEDKDNFYLLNIFCEDNELKIRDECSSGKYFGKKLHVKENFLEDIKNLILLLQYNELPTERISFKLGVVPTKIIRNTFKKRFSNSKDITIRLE